MARLPISSIDPTGRWHRVDSNFVDLYGAMATTEGVVSDLAGMIAELRAEIDALKQKIPDDNAAR